ncbi:MAG: hypothetical protein RRY21_02780 [Oscillospiraceae bacterium]
MSRTVASGAIHTMVVAALLSAVGIAIPMFSPIRLVLGPASYTLASHVPIFIAMFLSPAVAVAVSLVTTLGFFLGGFPLVIVLRALTHVIFAALGAFWLRRCPNLLSGRGWLPFSLVISALHALLEVLVVLPFYYGGGLSAASYTSGFFTTVIVLIGAGGLVHSMIDFALALWVWNAVRVSRGLRVGQGA